MRRAWFVCLACFLAAACGGASSTPTAATNPATPSGATTPPPQGSTAHAPTVTLAFDGPSSCMPIPPLDLMGGRPCILNVVATATDPDGDPLTYTWSGCTDFGSPPNKSICVVRQVGPVTATVTVSDGNGHSATASVNGAGTPPPADFVNHPPSVSFGYWVPVGQVTLEGLGMIKDPDEGELSYGRVGPFNCPYIKAIAVSGDCRTNEFAVLSCTTLEGLDLDIYRTKASGTCALTMTVQDSWGLATTTTFNVTYPTSGRAGVRVR